jgi:hypothetical protein
MHGLATAGVHGYIGGTLGQAHSSFEDPFVFLMHANVDRLFAMWQTAPGKAWRLDPQQVYGIEGNSTGNTGILTSMEPWAGGTGTRPWAPPENQILAKNCKDPSVVAPPCHDVTFQITDGPKRLTGPIATTFETPLGDTVTTPHAAGYTVPKAYVWISFRGTAAGDEATGEVTIHCNETSQD